MAQIQNVDAICACYFAKNVNIQVKPVASIYEIIFECDFCEKFHSINPDYLGYHI